MMSWYCPICGRYMRIHHRCPKSVLKAIDKANKEAMEDLEDEPKTEEERLSYGFSLLNGQQ